MMSASPQWLTPANRLLATLPRAVYERLLLYFECVHLTRNSVLYEIGDLIRDIYFINVGFTSLITMTTKGEMMELAAVGR